MTRPICPTCGKPLPMVYTSMGWRIEREPCQGSVWGNPPCIRIDPSSVAIERMNKTET